MPVRPSRRRRAAALMGTIPALAAASVVLVAPGTAAADGSVNGGERTLAAVTVTENFDSLSALTSDQSVVPMGIQLLELGTSGFADGEYNGNDGSSNSGNLFSYGSAGSGERALGSLNSGTNDPRFGILLRNTSGQPITDLTLSFTGEHWRRGGTARTDRLDFAYSTSDLVLNGAGFTDVNALDVVVAAGASTGALDGNAAANRYPVSGSLGGVAVPANGTVLLRWSTPDVAGSEDGIAVDDLSITATLGGGGGNQPVVPVCGSINASTGSAASLPLSASDGDGTVVSAAITSAPVPGITLGSVSPAGSIGGTLSTSLQVSAATSAGSYPVQVSFSNDDLSPQVGICTVNVTVSTVTLTAIHTIQGAGATSPISGSTVTIQGIVTGHDDEIGFSVGTCSSFPTDAGIYVQEEVSDYDTNPLTSEGIYVGGVAPRASYPIGTVVRVTGVVRDGTAAPAFGQTRIDASGAPVVLGTAVLSPAEVIDATTANAQSSAKTYYEALEGMLVTLPVGVAQSGGTNKFGELFMVPGTAFTTLQRTDPAANGLIGTVDDAGSGNPANPLRPSGISTAFVAADHGDEIQSTTGPMHFSFSNYKIAVQPAAMPTVVAKGRAWSAPTNIVGIRIASFNLENYFPAGGSLDCGTVSVAEHAEKTSRLVDAIGVHLGAPDVVAVQEVVDLATLQGLATALGTAGFGSYTAHLEEGNDNRGIDVGFLVKSTVAVNSVVQHGKTAANPTSATCSDISGRLFDRPPLALTFTAAAPVGQVTVYSNHFSSKAAPDTCRDAQAAYLAALVAALPPGSKAIVTGDLNAFEDETPLANLVAGTTLTNLWPAVDPESRYSFQFNGLLQTLDHMVVTDTVDPLVVDMTYAHLDNDFFDRDNPGDGRKVSDHDPPVLTLGDSSAVPQGASSLFVLAALACLALAWRVLLHARQSPAR